MLHVQLTPIARQVALRALGADGAPPERVQFAPANSAAARRPRVDGERIPVAVIRPLQRRVMSLAFVKRKVADATAEVRFCRISSGEPPVGARLVVRLV